MRRLRLPHHHNDVSLVGTCFQAISAFKILIFTRFTVNIDFSFVHAQFVQVKCARNRLNLALWTCQCVIIADVSKSVGRMMRGKRLF